MARNANDKILDNAYNAGDIEFEALKPPKVDDNYAKERMEDNYSSADYARSLKLREIMHSLILNSKHSELIGKKPPKNLIGTIFHDVKQSFEKTIFSSTGQVEYTHVEFFIVFIELFEITYELLYQSIFSQYKEQLIAELDKNTNILKKKGQSSLF